MTSESHSAKRCAKELGFICLGHFENSAICHAHSKRAHMLTETPVHVMILTVNIRGHHSA